MPCDSVGQHNTKCEWCQGGCQDNTGFSAPLENERCHYVVPGTAPSEANGFSTEEMVDIIFYRSKIPVTPTDFVNHLYASTRVGGPGSNWSVPAATNISDDVSNMNCGALPDGRTFLVSNAMVNAVRDPLYVTMSADGYAFDEPLVVASCEMPAFNHPTRQRWGCQFR